MSSPEEPAPQGPPRREVALVGLLALLIAAGLAFPGLGELGLWSTAELDVLDRTRAELGEPLRDLVRSPALPDALRTWAYERSPTDLALRLPGTLAALGLALLVAVGTRASGRSRTEAALAFACIASTPAWLGGLLTLLGPGVGELGVALAVVAGCSALGARAWSWRVALGLSSLLGLALATASLGLFLGAALPLCVLAIADVDIDRKVRALLGAGACGAVVATAWLVAHQGEGFIPLLGASKDPELVADPATWGLADTVEDLAYQLWLWAPAALAGALIGGSKRWIIAWFALGIAFAAAWSSLYGPTAAPVLVPSACLAARALMTLGDEQASATLRRFTALALLLGAAILGKDAERTPSEIVSPYFDLGVERFFPAEQVGTEAIFGGLTLLVLAALALSFAAAPPSVHDEADAPRIPEAVFPLRWRRALARGVLVSAAFAMALTLRFGLAPSVHAQLSAKAPFDVHRALVEAGAVNETLAFHRIRDPGVERYAPPRSERIYYGSRHQLTEALHGEEPVVALVRASDYPNFFQRARLEQRPFHALYADHADLVLVANFVPEGVTPVEPLADIVLDEVPDLEHETMLRFENLIEIVAWEIEGEIARGNTVTIHLALRPLKRMPAGTQIYARLLQGRISRVNGLPHDPAEGKYPPNLWREGDIIHHRYTFDIPRSSTLPGEHDVVVGFRRSEKKNLAITIPEREHGEFGVRIRGMKKREFAVIGKVDIK